MQTLEAKLGHYRHQVGLVGEVTVGRGRAHPSAPCDLGQGEALGPPLADQVQSGVGQRPSEVAVVIRGRFPAPGPVGRSRASWHVDDLDI